MNFPLNSSQLVDAWDLSNQEGLIANQNFKFLLPTEDVPSLLNNSKFIDTLGCSLNSQNASCLEVCGSVQDAFADWPNFYTCAWYPTISLTLAETNSSSSELTTLNSLGISDQQEFSSNISSTIANCLADYCNSTSDCLKLDTTQSCSIKSLLVQNGGIQMLNYTSAINCFQDSVCGTTSEVNADIGGLGVLLALLIQYTISLFAILLHLTFHLHYRRSIKLSKSKTGTQDKAKTRLDKRLESLTSALVEFQKAQSFFSTTLQIAALIVLPSYLSVSDTKNTILLRLTSANAFAPIMLTLAHISFLSDRQPLYLLMLSTISFMSGSATYWLSEPFTTGSSAADSYSPPTVPVLSCENIAPFAPCFLKNEFYLWGMWGQEDRGVFYYNLPRKTGLFVWIISLGILVWLVGCAIGENKFMKPGFAEIKRGISKHWHQIGTELKSFKYIQKAQGYWRRFPPSRTIKHLSSTFLHIASQKINWDYSILFLGSLAVLLQFISVLQVIKFSSDIIVMQMSFGQIVSVGIWVPIFLEYGYLEIRGAEEGTKYRLKAPLVVVNPQSATGQSGGGLTRK